MSVIGRLGRYIEVIDKLPGRQETISSQELAKLVGATPSTVRQDFHNFLSKKGKSRIGYDVKMLRKTLLKIFGLHNENKIVILGAGKLGRALAGYEEFKNINIRYVAFFDNDKDKVNTDVGGIPVYPIAELATFLFKNPDIKTAILTVPADKAQEVAAFAQDCGIEAIWNFSPVLLDLNNDVVIQNEYIGQNLYRLIYEQNQRSKKGGKKMELMICVGSSCHLKGSEAVVTTFQKLIEKEKLTRKVTLKGSFCMGHCSDTGVTVQLNGQFYKTNHEESEKFFYDTLMPVINKG